MRMIPRLMDMRSKERLLFSLTVIVLLSANWLSQRTVDEQKTLISRQRKLIDIQRQIIEEIIEDADPEHEPTMTGVHALPTVCYARVVQPHQQLIERIRTWD